MNKPPLHKPKGVTSAKPHTFDAITFNNDQSFKSEGGRVYCNTSSTDLEPDILKDCNKTGSKTWGATS